MVEAIFCWIILVCLAYVVTEQIVSHVHHFNDVMVVVAGSVLHWMLGVSIIWILLKLPPWTWAGYVSAYAFVILLLRIREPLTKRSLKRPKRVFFRHSELDVLVLGGFHLLVMRFIV